MALDEKDRKHRPGIERLLLRLRQGRDALQPEVIRTLDELERKNALADMYSELEKTLFTLRSHDTSLGSPFVFAKTRTYIRDRQRRLLGCEPALDDPQDAQGHHAMRIAAKKLRYTLEICDPVYGGQLADSIKAVKQAQSLLGEIHDCDVWVAEIDKFLDQERLATIEYFGHSRPFNRLKSGLLLLREDHLKHRRQVFIKLLEYWRGLDMEHFWSALENVVESRLEAPDQPCRELQDGQTHVGQKETETNNPAE